jgi:FkbM family methyltransferase
MKKLFLDFGPGTLGSEAWRKDMWEGYTIIGVEPDPTRYKQLKESYPGILLNLAVSDKIGTQKFVAHPTSGYIANGYPGLNEFHEVETTTADSIYEEYGHFERCRIWADIEGSELKMLCGATEVLKKTDWVNVELHTHPQTQEWCNSSEVYKFLEDLGFKTETKEKPYTPYHDSCYDALFIRNIIK